MRTQYEQGHKLQECHLIIGIRLKFGLEKMDATLETPLKIVRCYDDARESCLSDRIVRSYDVYKVNASGTKGGLIPMTGYSDVQYKVIEVY
jgi:hypothetical protein